MRESKHKLDYVLSLYTKAVFYASMLYCYSTAPLRFSTEIKTYHDSEISRTAHDQFNLMYGTRQARTCRAQVLLVHIRVKLLLSEVKAGSEVSSNGCLMCSSICSKVLAGAPRPWQRAPIGLPCFMGWKHHSPPSRPLPMPPKHPASHSGGAAGPQTVFIQSSLQRLRAEAMLAQY